MNRRQAIAALGLLPFVQWFVPVPAVPPAAQAAALTVADLEAARAAILSATGLRPNTLIMGRAVYEKLLERDEFVQEWRHAVREHGLDV